MLGSRDTKGSPPTRKKRNEHRFQRGEPRELVKWRTSSLNLALEPKTPRVWTCAQWIASTRRSEEPIEDGRPTYDEVPQLYIDPSECIDCGARVPVCPVTAIFAMDDLPEKWQALSRSTRITLTAENFSATSTKRQGDRSPKRFGSLHSRT